MFCNQCGTYVPDGKSFCTACGAPMDARPQGKKLPEEDTFDDLFLGGGFEAGHPAEIKGLGEYVPRKSNKKWFVLGGVLIAVAAIVLLVVFWLIPLLTKGPTEKILDAFVATSNAESLSADFRVTLDGEMLTGEFDMECSVRDKKANIYLDITMQAIPMEIYLMIEKDGGYAAVVNPMTGKYIAEKVMDTSEARDFFRSLEQASSNRNKFLEEFAANLNEEYDDVLDEEKFVEAMNKLLNKLDKKSTLEEVFDYEKEKEDGVTVHKFQPDLYQLMDTALPILKSAFENKDVYNALKKAMETSKESLQKTEFTVEVGLKGKYLASFVLETTDVQIEIDLSNVNKTKVKFEKEAKAAIEAAK